MDMFAAEFNDFCKQFILQKQYKLIDGKFGKVSVYQHTPTQKELLVKYIKSKTFNAIEPYVHYLMKNNKYFVNLYYSFNWLRGHLLIMDFVKEGDLFDLLKRQSLNEHEIKFIAFQVAEGVDALHSYKIIHNDIKLENVLCDAKLRIRLCDYGLCQHVGTKSTYDGTVDYFSPEKIEGRFYDTHFDWWALAIMVYEMFTDQMHPYKNHKNECLTVEKLKSRQQSKLTLPKNISTKAQNLLQSMLKLNINYRIINFKQIKQHVFFQNNNM
ncbi:protein kinase 1 [Orgyia leucostigma nucleopolyhedrovirus]|uniref:Protein kinase 1 n=1 Tax=Orgyia leucostigma nucleopolyhedrovirus TaxID=490711 RepID=B0FDM1_9ABAC|nr:protein kinase 1 [Orgyia leucostigma nucleopolyhedrovirus]ABY65729.1 protein kinase 1 [Orgyia leucostigma nucleopolyhedrovirus]